MLQTVLPHLRIRATLAAKGTARVPAYKGSMLRGAFGHSLRRDVCAMGPDQDCRTCPLSDACIHARLFEGPQSSEARPFFDGQPMAPNPYVFEPLEGLLGDRRDLQAGDELTFDLILIGQVAEFRSFAVKAIERMAESGLGPERSSFELRKISYPQVQLVPAPVPGRAVRIRFVTPMRVKAQGRLVDTIDFPVLVQRALSRILGLAYYYVPSRDVDPEAYRGLVERAEDIRMVSSDLHWRDWRRYSNRQQTKMALGGIVGEMTVEGDLAPYTALLRTAEVVHVGKGTSFGLGRIEIDESENQIQEKGSTSQKPSK